VKRIATMTAIAMLAAAAGCASQSHTNPGVTDLQPTPAAPVAAAPAAETSAPAPEMVASTDTTTPPAPDGSLAGGASTGQSQYTVRAGDTLYHIALVHYGSGRDWKKILAANPGLTPQTLRVGQTIVLP
jgi:nucleoid-associated protein YgaU